MTFETLSQTLANWGQSSSDSYGALAERIARKLGDGVREHVRPESVDRIPYDQFCIRFFPHYIRKGWSKLHIDAAAELNTLHLTRGQRKGRIAPRGGAKTTHYAKLYSLYCICYELEPYIVLSGSTDTGAERNLSAIKNELEQNVMLRIAFPHVCGRGAVWNAGKIVTRNRVTVEAVGRSKKIRGMTSDEHRPTLIIGDDIDDEDSVSNPDAREKAWEWLTKTLIPTGIEEEVNVIIVGTTLDPDDILHRTSRTPGWDFKRYASIIRWPNRDDLWREWLDIFRQATFDRRDGLIPKDAEPEREFFESRRAEMEAGSEILWPEQESLYSLQVYIARNGMKSFRSEKQGEYVGTGKTEWAADLFPDQVYFDKWPPLSIKVAACDPSKGKSDKSDYSAWIFGGLGVDGYIYVDADIERRNSREICSTGVRIVRALSPHITVMESDAYGAIAELWAMVAAEQGLLESPIRMITHHVAKMVRIRRLTAPLTAFRFRFRKDSPGVKLLISQLMGYPLDNHDDGPDCLEMFLCALQQIQAEIAVAKTESDRDEIDDGFVLEHSPDLGHSFILG